MHRSHFSLLRERPVSLRLWFGAVTLPFLSHGAALVVNVEPGAWLSMPDRLRWALGADALLFTAAAVIVAAPVAGVVAGAATTGGEHRSTRHRMGIIVASVMLCSAVSGLLTFGWAAGREDGVAFVMQSHVTLFAVTLALAAGGALSAAFFRNPLDAAALAVVVSLTVAGGLLVAGSAIADAPRPLITAGVTVSPLFAVASAANIDLVRMDVPYQISPLAHMQMAYPAWASTAAWYLGITALECLAFAGLSRARSSAAP